MKRDNGTGNGKGKSKDDPGSQKVNISTDTGNSGHGNIRRHPLELKIPPIVVFAIFVVIMWGIDTWFPVFAVTIPFRPYLVIFLSATALSVAYVSFQLLIQKGTTIFAHKPDKVTYLVTTGPYKHTRNPMYLSLSLVLIAWAIFLSDLLALMLMPAFYAYITRFQIIPEERELTARFGETYEGYADRTPRWL